MKVDDAINGLNNLKLFMRFKDKTNEVKFNDFTYECINIGMETLRKKITKNPIGNDNCTCPNCGTYNEIIKKRRNTVPFDTVYCWHCGQAIEVRSDDK
jgi:hypothetical protein